MAEPVPAGSDVSAGSYDCTNCGYRLDVQSTSICRRWGMGCFLRRRRRERSAVSRHGLRTA
jgi:hypothetical protein